MAVTSTTFVRREYHVATIVDARALTHDTAGVFSPSELTEPAPEVEQRHSAPSVEGSNVAHHHEVIASGRHLRNRAVDGGERASNSRRAGHPEGEVHACELVHP